MKKIDFYHEIRYNVDMEKIQTAIIGGGAAGLMLATSLKTSGKTVVFERGERVGKKLSATGNGQGNITNLAAEREEYFSFSGGAALSREIVARYNPQSLLSFFEHAGLLLQADERGRVYPAGRQASALTDALRFLAAKRGVELCVKSRVLDLEKQGQGFVLSVQTDENPARKIYAEKVVLCTGGTVARSFGTDGTAYALAQKFGHTLTPLYPSLVQLKADSKELRALKGIRVADAEVTALFSERAGGELHGRSIKVKGDIMFADYGVSGDSIFRLSAFLTHRIQDGVTISIDFLPEFEQAHIFAALQRKRETFPELATGELLCGFVNNQIARVVMKRANGDLRAAARSVKAFTLTVTGHLGLDLAQVTKGGIRMDEVDNDLQSKKQKGLYFAGEILDIDGQCGGYNLQWAYSSACTVAAAIDKEIEKTRGQV